MQKLWFSLTLFVVLALSLISGCTAADFGGGTGSAGGLNISSTPPAAQVYIDNAYVGVTPLFLQNVEVGTHTIKVTRGGYQDYSMPVGVFANQTTPLDVELIPIGQPSGENGNEPSDEEQYEESQGEDGQYNNTEDQFNETYGETNDTEYEDQYNETYDETYGETNNTDVPEENDTSVPEENQSETNRISVTNCKSYPAAGMSYVYFTVTGTEAIPINAEFQIKDSESISCASRNSNPLAVGGNFWTDCRPGIGIGPVASIKLKNCGNCSWVSFTCVQG